MNGTRATPPLSGSEASLLRVPPHNLAAEQGVIASVLLNNDLMNAAVEILRPEDFYQGAHRTLFSVMIDLYDRGRAIDQLTLSSALQDRGVEGEIGGLAYLSDLIQNVPTTANVAEYARLVKNASILRRTISVAQQITTAAFQGVSEVDDFLDKTEQAIFAIAEEKIKPSYFTMAEMAKESMKEIEKLFERKEMITGVPSGFRDLDQLTSGFQKSDMVIIAARPSMGKTAFCLDIARNASIKHKLPVAIFSLEMSRHQLALRMICSDARVNSKRLRSGYLAQDEMNRIVASVGRLSEAPIYIDDSDSLTALELRAKARRLKKEKDIGLMVVDYLQLMRGTSFRASSDNRVQEVSEISRSLKSLAKELDIPVIAISQLSRNVENRNDKRPLMSDLRECVTGDTLVMTTDGCRVPIRDLVGTRPEVWAMSAEGRIVPAKSDLIWSVGKKPVTRVALASGRTIRATEKHLLYGADGWVRVADLKPGDRIAVARSVPEPFRSNTNVDTLPKEVFLQVKAAMAGKGISHREMAALRGTAYGGSYQFGFAPSRPLLMEYANLLDDDSLKGWAASDLFWDRVVDMGRDGVEDVFDLTVPGPSSWLADGIISHNSGALEQDSDLILFIYREEMYAKGETPDDKKGVAEVIIGKHRNGPTGDISLAFLSPYTRFEDLAKDYE